MGGRLLIVDDNATMRTVLSFVAETAGFEVCATAENGRRAVELARTERPDAVILDQEMPVMDGITALPLILAAAPDTVVAMFSSAEDSDVIRAALERGAAAFFRKGPDTVDDVLAFLRERTSAAAEPPGR